MDDTPSLHPDYQPLEEPLSEPPRPARAQAGRMKPAAAGPARRRAGRRGPVLGLLALVIAAPSAYAAYRLIAPESDRASLEGALPPMVPLEFSNPDAEPGLTPAVGPDLSAPAGASLLLAVRALGAGGVPLADTVVRFEVVAGDGSLTAPTIRTDGEGLAAVSLELAATPGTTLVSVEVDGSPMAPVRFEVTTVTGLPERIEIVGGDAQEVEAGGLLAERMAVRVSDAAGNAVPGTEVLFQVLSGGGIVGPTRLRTDSLGVASARWRLGFASGTQRLSAMAAEAGATVTFTATAEGGLVAPSPTGPGTGPDSTESATSEPTPTVEPVTVARMRFAVGGSHVCALSGGRAVCRGANDRGQASSTAPAGLAAVAAGTTHACGLDASGAASCWGANDSGQLGDGTRTDRTTGAGVATELRFSRLTAGASHTCGLAGGGRAACWGQNLSGQLGDGSRDDRTTPHAVAGGHRFSAIAAGWNHTCAVTSGGEAYCWGLNSDGQLGDGSRLDRLLPTRLPGRFTSVAAGTSHTCAVAGGQVMCWGGNRFGQVGDGSTEGRTAPVAVEGLPGPTTLIAAGAVHTCALVSDGSAYCWGQNLHGQLGDGSTESRSTPSAVGGSLRFESIHAGGAVTCGFTASGAQYCWGLNQGGQLGDGTRASRSLPTRVGG